jgi:hypothetical protein
MPLKFYSSETILQVKNKIHEADNTCPDAEQQ